MTATNKKLNLLIPGTYRMLKQNILVAADVLVFYKDGKHVELLLVKRRNEPFKGMWAFPGGFVEDDEELEHAAARELREETGLQLQGMKQLHTFGKVGRDPRGRTVSVTYYAIIHEKQPVTGADDAAEAHWVPLQDIKEMAFDHKEALEFVLQMLDGEMK
jgi:8-oxo-dGTP diphosphatase